MSKADKKNSVLRAFFLEIFRVTFRRVQALPCRALEGTSGYGEVSLEDSS